MVIVNPHRIAVNDHVGPHRGIGRARIADAPPRNHAVLAEQGQSSPVPTVGRAVEKKRPVLPLPERRLEAVQRIDPIVLELLQAEDIGIGLGDEADDPLHLIFAFAERILAEKPFHIIAQHAQRSGLARLLVAPAQLGTEKLGDMSQAEQRGKQQQQGDRSPAHRPVKRQHDVGHIKKRSRQAQKGEPRGPARIDVRRQIGKHQRRDQKRQHEDDRIRRRKQNARTLFLLIAYSHGSRMTARSPEASSRHPAPGSRTGSDARRAPPSSSRVNSKSYLFSSNNEATAIPKAFRRHERNGPRRFGCPTCRDTARAKP